ncbi:MAG: hypothetical protein QOF06_860 [Solirubrobacterales bacterium]|jgi:hypothetical protein|nr:hypothetical protein [Solirubrobacterales bacterium]
MPVPVIAFDRFIRLIRDLRRDERGIAVPTALMALIATFAISSVAVMSTVDVQQGTKRDHDSKEAIAAADAGANIALLRLNRYLPSLTTAHPCIGPNGEYQSAVSGWCPATTTESVGGATYSYAVSAYAGTGKALNVVSVGASGTVQRRVNVAMLTSSGKGVFADEKFIGQDEITVKGNFKIEADIGTNGNIVQSGGAGTICGDERHGVGKGAPTPSCSGVKVEEIRELPAIVPPANLATENANCLLAQKCTSGLFIGQSDTWTKSNPWTASTRTINVGQQGTLTMNGGDYFICKLDIGPGTVYMSAQAHVRIFIDAPQNCGMASGATQLNISGNGNLVSSGYNPKQGLYNIPEIFLLGNGSVSIGANSGTNHMMLYAPQSAIDMGGNAEWVGMFAGKSINLHGDPFFKSDPNIKEPGIAYAGRFQRTRYVECTGATASPPNASC